MISMSKDQDKSSYMSVRAAIGRMKIEAVPDELTDAPLSEDELLSACEPSPEH